MNHSIIRYILCRVLEFVALFMSLPCLVGVIYREKSTVYFVIVMAGCLFISLIGRRFKPKSKVFYAREGFVTVSLSWMLISSIGALPFYLSGEIPSYTDALFETISGFTTTGATILPDVEKLSRCIQFWRCFTHWIGGMGVLVFMLAILPSGGGATIHIMRAEVPGPTKGKLVPKLRQTALILYGIYIAITLLETISLLIAELNLYDALVTSFATTGTGGFSVKNASIAGFASPAVEWIVAVFMLLSGVNFNIYFYVLIRSFTPIIKNSELKVYLSICLLSSVAITLLVWFSEGFSGSFGDAVRHAFFQVASIMSTTGFTSLDYGEWPFAAQTILFILTFIGACGGSTAGGLKISRLIIVFKMMRIRLRKMLKPNSVDTLRMDGETISEEVGSSALGYFAFYCIITALTVLLISIDGNDLTTNITAAATCFNNVGPGLGELIGPAGNFSCFSSFSTLILSATMLLGRLEIFPLLVLFSPSTWSKN